METEVTPNILQELLADVPPAGEYLVKIYRSLGEATLGAEEGRLRERFLDIASRLSAINQIGEDNGHTVLA